MKLIAKWWHRLRCQHPMAESVSLYPGHIRCFACDTETHYQHAEHARAIARNQHEVGAAIHAMLGGGPCFAVSIPERRPGESIEELAKRSKLVGGPQ